MKKVTTHLSGNAHAILQACPGQTDGDRVRWLVDYFGQVLDARARGKAIEAARAADEEIVALKPAALAIVRDAADAVMSERERGALS